MKFLVTTDDTPSHYAQTWAILSCVAGVLDLLYIKAGKRWVNHDAYSVNPDRSSGAVVLLVLLYYIMLGGILSLIEAHSYGDSVAGFSLIGFLSYTTWNITALATHPHWTVLAAVVDTFWGVVLYILLAIISHGVKEHGV
jgi:uncharacterized membrane protein